jgi:hypothetical protein
MLHPKPCSSAKKLETGKLGMLDKEWLEDNPSVETDKSENNYSNNEEDLEDIEDIEEE